MKRKVILHIGRHKSGTTALQEYLFDHKNWLFEQGFEYPDLFISEKAHHGISREFLRYIVEHRDFDLTEQIIQDLQFALYNQTSSHHTLIISSEGFQECDPFLIRRIFDSKIFDVQIVCYFREQVSYAASSYAQIIHAQLEIHDLELYLESFVADYYSFSKEWSDLFGNITAVLFDKNYLLNGNIIDDFFDRILSVTPPSVTEKDTNPSLTRRYLAFKYLYNQKIDSDEVLNPIDPDKLYILLGEFSRWDDSGRFTLSTHLENYIEEKFCVSNTMFFSQFLDGRTFNLLRGKSSKCYSMNDNEFYVIYEHLKNHEYPLIDNKVIMPQIVSSTTRTILIHAHIFKNAGSTFDASLNRSFGDNFIENINDDQLISSENDFLLSSAKANSRIKAFSSHSLFFHPIGNDRYNFITVYMLRHPIERILSVYEFEKIQLPAIQLGSKMAKVLDFKSFVSWYLTDRRPFTIRNAQTVFLAGQGYGLDNIEDKFILADERLLADDCLIGIVDRYDESMVVFEEKLKPLFHDIDLSYPRRENVGSYSFANNSTNIDKKVQIILDELGHGLAKEVINKNIMDMELYNKANLLLTEAINNILDFEQKLDEFKKRCVAIKNKIEG